MSQHTPGPWEVSTGSMPLAYYVKASERKGKRHLSYMVCAVGDHDDTGRNLANARLIAAAPALLEALEMLVDDSAVIMPIELIHHFGASLNKARAAIAQAKNGQS